MLAYLHGTIQSKENTNGPSGKLTLDVSGIGLEIHLPYQDFLKLKNIGETTTIHTSLTIRENDWTIFGFLAREQKDLFNLLQSVSGIGPRLALALVGSLSAKQLAEAIVAEDTQLITQAPGVGPKVAQRIVLELKSKIKDWLLTNIGSSSRSPDTSNVNELNQEVSDILSNLGYTISEINFVLTEAQQTTVSQDVESLMRFCLKTLTACK